MYKERLRDITDMKCDLVNIYLGEEMKKMCRNKLCPHTYMQTHHYDLYTFSSIKVLEIQMSVGK